MFKVKYFDSYSEDKLGDKLEAGKILSMDDAMRWAVFILGYGLNVMLLQNPDEDDEAMYILWIDDKRFQQR